MTDEGALSASAAAAATVPPASEPQAADAPAAGPIDPVGATELEAAAEPDQPARPASAEPTKEPVQPSTAESAEESAESKEGQPAEAVPVVQAVQAANQTGSAPETEPAVPIETEMETTEIKSTKTAEAAAETAEPAETTETAAEPAQPAPAKSPLPAQEDPADTTADADETDKMQTEAVSSPAHDGFRGNSLPPRAEDVVARIKESHQRPAKRSKPNSDSEREDSVPATVPPTVNVNNEDVLATVASFKRRIVGSVVYEPKELLFKKFDDSLNCIVEVRVARRWLSLNHQALRDRALWGTGVYTDDSDVVAALYHEGYLTDDKFGDSGCDLLVQVVILPSLKKYQGSTRHDLNSRTWLSPHDGTSILIAKVEPMAQGSAENPVWRRREAALNWSEAYALSRPASGRATPSPAEV